MKKLLCWMFASMVLMLGCPWLAVTFAGTAGMAVCLVLFFGANPVFSLLCGAAAGKDVRRLWPVPILNAASFLTGAWIFFEMGEPAFLLYGGIYLIIGLAAMLVRALLNKNQ